MTADTNSDGPSREQLKQADQSVKQDVLGSRGVKIGPFMLSTNRTILEATARATLLIAMTAYGIWLTASTQILTGIAQSVAIGALVLLSVFGLHISYIFVYSGSASTQLTRWADSLGETGAGDDQ